MPQARRPNARAGKTHRRRRVLPQPPLLLLRGLRRRLLRLPLRQQLRLHGLLLFLHVPLLLRQQLALPRRLRHVLLLHLRQLLLVLPLLLLLWLWLWLLL